MKYSEIVVYFSLIFRRPGILVLINEADWELMVGTWIDFLQKQHKIRHSLVSLITDAFLPSVNWRIFLKLVDFEV